MPPDILYKIALTLIPNVGNVLAKSLLAYCGSAKAVFNQSKAKLLKVPGIGPQVAESILTFSAFDRAQTELDFIEKHGITPLFFSDTGYPEKLKHIADAPMMVYTLGAVNLQSNRMLGVVGTRKASDEAKEFCTRLIAELKPYNCTIVSGLAYGIDITAHKAAIDNQMPTIAVLAHGLDRLYPASHKNTAKRMLENGGLLTEYTTGTNPDRENFPTRNRIAAGLCDAVVVIETDVKGGSMITAEIAFGYNRDVFAVPTSPANPNKGCNHLIKTNKAALIECAEDIAQMMGWEANTTKQQAPQVQLLFELSNDEQKVVEILRNNNGAGMDDIGYAANLTINQTAMVLLELELKNVVKSLPGKMYKLR